jgi:uncharacterized protein (TIGR02145 family)
LPIGGGANRYGALWTVPNTWTNVNDLSISRVAASASKGSWAATPVGVDAKQGLKTDYLPVRCVSGVGETVAVGAPHQPVSLSLTNLVVVPKDSVPRGGKVQLAVQSAIQPAGSVYTWSATPMDGGPAWLMGTTNTPSATFTAPNANNTVRYSLSVVMSAAGYQPGITAANYRVSGCAAVSQAAIVNQTVCPDADVIFSPGNATGGDSPTYQWQTRTVYGDWVDGATTVNLTVAAPAAPTYYRRNVISCGIMYYGNEALVATYSAPAQSTLAGRTVCPSTATTLSPTAPVGGNGSYTYAWEWADAATGPWSAPEGTTNTASYTVPATAITVVNTTKYYKRTVTSCGLQHVSGAIAVATSGGLTQTAIAQKNVCPGAAVTISLGNASGGNGSFTYTWQYSTNNSTWTDFSATGAIDNVTVTAYSTNAITFTAPSAATTYSPYFRRVVTSCGGNVTLTPAGVRGAYTNGGVTQVYLMGDRAEVCAGSQYTFNLAAATGGNGTYTYQWQTSTNHSSNWVDIPGATERTLTVTAPSTPLTWSPYYARVASSCGFTHQTKSQYALGGNLRTYGSITQAVLNDITTCDDGNPIAISLAASTAPNVTYQWQASDDFSGGYTDIPGETGVNLNNLTKPTADSYSKYYRRKASACLFDDYTQGARIYSRPNTATAAGTLPTEYTSGAGVKVTLTPTAPAGLDSYVYQWQNGGADSSAWVDISGATGATYVFTVPAYEGGYSEYFRRSVRSSCGSGDWLSTNATRVYIPIECPYTNADLVAGSCQKRTGGKQNWEARIHDVRDGKEYRMVQIGNQWWMAQNLNYQKNLTFNSNANSPANGMYENFNLTGHFWCPAGDNVNTNAETSAGSNQNACDTYGALYSWMAAAASDGGVDADNSALQTNPPMGVSASWAEFQPLRGVCPTGWHLPTQTEWQALGAAATQNELKATATCGSGVTFCSTDAVAAWGQSANNQGTDAYGFSALPAGYKSAENKANNVQLAQVHRYRGVYTWFITSTVASYSDAYRAQLYYGAAGTFIGTGSKSLGFSVRCISDNSGGTAPEVQNTAPTGIEASFGTVVSGTPTTLTATGGVLGTRGKYKWTGAGATAADTLASITVSPTAVGAQTYTVCRQAQDGSLTSAASVSITVQAAGTCPYTQSDLIVNTCGKRGVGANNWQVTFKDASDGDKQYPAVKIGNMWWMAKNLDKENATYGIVPMTGIGIPQPQSRTAQTRIRAFQGMIYPTSVAGVGGARTASGGLKSICPSGWIIPAHRHVEALVQAATGKVVEWTAPNAIIGGYSVVTPTNHRKEYSNRDDYFGLNGAVYSLGYPYTSFPNITVYGGGNLVIPTDQMVLNSTGERVHLYLNSAAMEWKADWGGDSYIRPVRCVADMGSFTPQIALGADLIPSGSSAVFTATSNVVEPGATYEWGTGEDIGANVIAGVTGATYTLGPLAASVPSTTYWVRIKEADGTYTAATKLATDITIIPADSCPYTGTDLVSSSCKISIVGTRYWTAQIKDSRDDIIYDIMRLPNGSWWMSEMLKYGTCTTTSGAGGLEVAGGTCMTCGGVWLYNATAARAAAAATTDNPSGLGGICPSGWHLPGPTEANEKLYGITAVAFGTSELSAGSLSNTSATKCAGNGTRYYWHTSDASYYWTGDATNTLAGSTGGTDNGFAIRCVKD